MLLLLMDHHHVKCKMTHTLFLYVRTIPFNYVYLLLSTMSKIMMMMMMMNELYIWVDDVWDKWNGYSVIAVGEFGDHLSASR